MNEWIVISKKNKNKKRSDGKKFWSTNQVIDKLFFLLKNICDIKSAFLFGSVAKGIHTESSDIDILIIWNKIPSDSAIINLKLDIIKEFDGKNIDLISMKYTGKISIDFDDYDDFNNRICFLENVFIEAMPIIGLVDDIKLSIYIQKN